MLSLGDPFIKKTYEEGKILHGWSQDCQGQGMAIQGKLVIFLRRLCASSESSSYMTKNNKIRFTISQAERSYMILSVRNPSCSR